MMAMDSMTEYEATMQSAERRVFHLLHSIEWQMHTERKTSCLWRMKCNITEDFIFRYEGLITDKTPAEVAAYIHPEGLYRGKWDSQSAGTSIVARLGEKTSIIRHDTKPRLMGLISARETVDLCRFETDENTGARHVVLVSVSHPDAPSRNGVVRAFTHPTLVMIEPSGDGSKVTAILHGEMNLTGVPTTIRDSFLPKGILNFFDDLTLFAKKDVKVNLNVKLTGWLQ